MTKLTKAKPESDAAAASAAAALGQLQREHEILVEANAALKNEIEDRKLVVAVAQSEHAQLHHEMKSEIADRDCAFANAQETIAGLEKGAERETRRLMAVHAKKDGSQLDPIPESNQQNFGNAQHFNMDREDSPEAPRSCTRQLAAKIIEGFTASSSSEPKPAKFFYPTIQPKTAQDSSNERLLQGATLPREAVS